MTSDNGEFLPYYTPGRESKQTVDFAARWEMLKGKDFIVDARRYQGRLCDLLTTSEERFISFPLLQDLQFAPGELTVWGGDNGSGKSLLLGQVAMYLISQGQTVCIMSFEMSPTDTILRMMKQSFGHRPSEEEAVKWFQFVGGKLYLYTRTGAIDPDTCFGCCHYAATELACDHVIVDNLMMLSNGRDSDQNMAAQKVVATSLKAIAMTTHCHIHLVAHLRKRDKVNPALPSKYDIAGTSNVANLADNIVLVARGQKKIEASNGEHYPDEGFDQQNPDVFLKLDKNRRSGINRLVPCWYDPVSMQFCPKPGRWLMSFLPKDCLSDDFYDARKVPAVQRMLSDYNKSFKGEVR